MSLVRDLPFTMVAMEEHMLITCSDPMSTAGSTAGTRGLLGSKTTAGVLVSTGDIGMLSTVAKNKQVSSGGMVVATTFGKVIDRLRFPLGAHYPAAAVSAWINSTVGSTQADRKLAIGVKLQAGDSSGGGDLADYTTAYQPDDRIYFGTSIRTCDMLNWDFSDESTGVLFAPSHTGYYDLRGAGRYLRVVPRVGKNRVTTETSGDEGARVGATITFLSADQLPVKADTTSPFSSTTSTA